MAQTCWIASFDIGYRNLCFCIEEYNIDSISSIKKIAKKDQYNDDGTMTDAQSKIIQSICKNSKTIMFKNTDLTKETMKVLNYEVFHLLTDLLDEYQSYWDKCSAFIIEKQMSFKGVYNVSALKLGQHCWSYFAFKYSRFKEIIEFPAYYKTQVLGAPKVISTTKTGKTKYKAMDKPQRKKWAITKAVDVLAEREDFDTMTKLQSSKKKDDISDCILQAISAVYLIYIDQSL
jgi:hypothetical protein